MIAKNRRTLKDKKLSPVKREDMIDKLDKWIAQQRHKEWVNCIFPEIPKMRPEIAFPDGTKITHQKTIDEMIKEATLKEREACAKLCENAKGYYPNDIGGGFAKLIRERSDD